MIHNKSYQANIHRIFSILGNTVLNSFIFPKILLGINTVIYAVHKSAVDYICWLSGLPLPQRAFQRPIEGFAKELISMMNLCKEDCGNAGRSGNIWRILCKQMKGSCHEIFCVKRIVLYIYMNNIYLIKNNYINH